MRGWNEYSATNRQHWHHNLVTPAPPARTLESRSPDLWQRTPVTQVMTVAFLCSRLQDFVLSPAAGGCPGILTPADPSGGSGGRGSGGRPPGQHCGPQRSRPRRQAWPTASFRCLDQGLWSLNQLGQYPAHVRGVEEGDRRAHRAMPGALVEQAHPAGTDRLKRGVDVRHAVADVMNALAAPGEELPHRCVWAKRFEQLDPGGARWPGGDPEHRLTHPLVLMDLPAYHTEFEHCFVKGYLGCEIVASDPHVVDPVQHRCLPRRPGSLGIVADIPPWGLPRGREEQWREACQKR